MTLLISVFRSFKRRRASAFFPILGVAVGVMLVVLVSSVGAVGKSAVTSEISALGLDGLVISSSAQSLLSEKELNYLRQNEVTEKATPLVYEYSKIIARGDSERCLLWGVDEQTDEVMNVNVVFGRNITRQDVLSQKNVCLIDCNYALENYGRKNIVGKNVIIQTENGNELYEVVGVTDGENSLINNVVSEFVPAFVYLPYTVFRNSFGDCYFNSIAVTVKDNIDFNSAEKALSVGLEDFSASQGFKIENMFSHTKTIEDILNIITVVLSGIAAISLVVSGMSVMTVMLFSVGERTGEIGIKKAIGASFSDILFEFLAESVVITLLGCALGLALGFSVCIIGFRLFSIEPVFDFKMLSLCVVVTAAFGLVFGIYPASRAAKLNPVEALRRN